MSPRPSGLVTGQVLAAIAGGHRYGADIMEHTGRSGGTVYKVLRRLEDRELVTGQFEDPALAERERRPRRRYYRLTSAGRTDLDDAIERYPQLDTVRERSKKAGTLAPQSGRA